MKKFIILIGLLLIVSATANDYTSLLNINFGSRAMMAGSCESVDINDFQTILTNPALLSFSQWNFVRINYLNYIMDTNFTFLGIGDYNKNIGMWALSILYGNYGYQESRDQSGNSMGNFFSNEKSLVFTMSDIIYHNIYLGTNIKFLQSQFGGYSSNSFLFDFGLAFRIKHVILGIYLKNFGTKMQFDQFGVNDKIEMGIGFRYRHNFKNRKTSLILLNDYNFKGNDIIINSGIKLILFKILTVGTGIYDIFNDYNRRYNVGISIDIKHIGIDFVYGFNKNYLSLYNLGIEYRW